MKIAVVGGGIGGCTAAWQLALLGHTVTLFEQAPKCGPVGAGILLQPAGQFVLERMGLLDEVVAGAQRIDALHAQDRGGRKLVHLTYETLDADLFGLGVLRGHLFSLLLQRCISAGVIVREGTRITSWTETPEAVIPVDESATESDPFDILIAADGSRSQLRAASGLAGRIHEYDEAALWLTGPCSSARDHLLQLVDKSGRLVGILPLGNDRASFFWGLTRAEHQRISTGSLRDWKDQVTEFYPPAAEILEPVESFEQTTFATYRNVRMRAVTSGRVVFIGDAAHATSPHLGQGAGLALGDAECLVNHVRSTDDFRAAFAGYAAEQRAQVRFYSQLTGFLTPFFQTSSRVRQLGRNLVLPLMPHLPFIGHQMVLTMAGLKRGWFSFRR